MAIALKREAPAETPWLTYRQARCDVFRGGRGKCRGVKGRVYKARMEMACLNGASYQSLPSPTTDGQVNPHLRPTSAEGVRQRVGAAWFRFTAA